MQRKNDDIFVFTKGVVNPLIGNLAPDHLSIDVISTVYSEAKELFEVRIK